MMKESKHRSKSSCAPDDSNTKIVENTYYDHIVTIMLKVFPVSLQTFFDIPNCFQYNTVYIPNLF